MAIVDVVDDVLSRRALALDAHGYPTGYDTFEESEPSIEKWHQKMSHLDAEMRDRFGAFLEEEGLDPMAVQAEAYVQSRDRIMPFEGQLVVAERRRRRADYHLLVSRRANPDEPVEEAELVDEDPDFDLEPDWDYEI